jgi:hypothetical protein
MNLALAPGGDAMSASRNVVTLYELVERLTDRDVNASEQRGLAQKAIGVPRRADPIHSLRPGVLTAVAPS